MPSSCKPIRFSARRAGFLAALAFTVTLDASANLVSNGSFEDGTNAPTPGNSTQVGNGDPAIAGWTVATKGSDIEWEGQGYSSLVTPAGTRFIDLTGNPDLSPRATISQTLVTAVGATYRLTFIVGVDNDVPSFSGPVGVTVGIDSTSTNFAGIDPSGAGNVWTSESLDFTASRLSTNLSFLGIQGTNYIGLDSVDVEFLSGPPEVPPTMPTAPGQVPEPGSLTLVVLGTPAMACGRRRRTAARLDRSVGDSAGSD